MDTKNATPTHPAPTASGPRARRFSDVEMKPKEFLVQGLFPLGELSAVFGTAGTGKSQVVLSLAAAVTKGTPWPTGNHSSTRGSVIYINGEDELEYTTLARFSAIDGDHKRIYDLSGFEVKGQKSTFKLKKHLTDLEDDVSKIGDVKLVVIDPMGLHGGLKSMNSNEAVRGLLEPLANLAKKYGLAVVLVSHSTKQQTKVLVHNLLGSVGFGAAIRTAYEVGAIERDGRNQGKFYFRNVKNNYGTTGLSYTYSIKSVELNEKVKTSRVVFESGAEPDNDESAENGDAQ